MKKILISWVATKNDFIENKVTELGPNYRFHQYFYKDYLKHVIISAENESKERTKGLELYSYIKRHFTDHQIQLIYIPLELDEVINFNIIYAKVYQLLSQYKEYSIDIFVSPGTPTMQTVWHIIHLQKKFKTRLLQTIKPEDSLDGEPKLIEINIENHIPTDYLILKENLIINNKKSDYCNTTNFVKTKELAEMIANTDKTTVLIQGETGTGKEEIASIIHCSSNRKNKPFKKVNCASIGSELLESRLFGHVKGAFTSANEEHNGFFKSANNGTIFLDEIGDISPFMQIALLRVLQEGEIQKVGSNISEKVNVRVIVATNKDLYKCCQEGSFRWDLYYRLCVAEIKTLPLRLRGAREIKELIKFFNISLLDKMNLNRKLIEIPIETMELLCNYSWPGNIRELKNLIESSYAYNIDRLTLDKLPLNFLNETLILSDKLEDVKRHHINKVFKLCGGNMQKAKKILDVGSVNTIKAYIKNT